MAELYLAFKVVRTSLPNLHMKEMTMDIRSCSVAQARALRALNKYVIINCEVSDVLFEFQKAIQVIWFI